MLGTPGGNELESLAATLAAWQQDGGPIQLHPGDLGWYSMRGPEATARALRAWSRDGELIALGLLDGPDGLLRLAVDPKLRSDESVARQLCSDISDPARGVLPDGEAIVEARGAVTLQHLLLTRGWQFDQPWTPMHRDLAAPVPDTHVTWPGLRVEVLGPDRAEAWMEVHWSAFKGTPFGEAERRPRLVGDDDGRPVRRARSLSGRLRPGRPGCRHRRRLVVWSWPPRTG